VTALACLVHWYEATLFVVPTGAVSAWGWWSARGADKRDGKQRGTPPRA